MESICIKGGVALQGKVRIQGSKNAALPVLAATLLTRGTSYIRNCPKISDVFAMISLLSELGCVVNWQKDGLTVDSSGFRPGEMGAEAVKGMRSSLCLLGAVIGRCGEVVMEYPGGCVIGVRPIDLHIRALQEMGVNFTFEDGKLRAETGRLRGSALVFDKCSVGATENVILAGVAAEGDTVVEGAAGEPEIAALCDYLIRCGADIEGVGTKRLVIHGGRRLHGADYKVPADRIVAGTYLFACMGTGGNVFLEEAPAKEMGSVLALCVRMGGKYCITEEGLFVQGPARLRSPGKIRTDIYPGFPTDLQSVAMTAAAVAAGDTVVQETIFENRFRVVEELKKMGAKIISYSDDSVLVKGVPALRGGEVEAMELRGGAALITAGLMAAGETKVTGCSYIYRGYENICRDFRELGARIVSV